MGRGAAIDETDAAPDIDSIPGAPAPATDRLLNATAQDFYERLGWKEAGRRPRALRLAADDHRDEALMTLDPLCTTGRAFGNGNGPAGADRRHTPTR
ncbi:hypothetical protein JQK87_09520 [Streptomyces sp. G44]|uniref:hypothetical protein n=1 Tax=Streptomyces sp. G44 TaxID=2807632 RepID=UPI0019605814|nr:hypothetical protein [Streptomyces sp. G44]MBM7168645.1 hypothetical protein [Streptomyces sp. G44]